MSSRSGSIQSTVPVKPVWPYALSDIRLPNEVFGPLSCHPRPRLSPMPAVKLRVASSTVAGDSTLTPR